MRLARTWFLALVVIGCGAPALSQVDDDDGGTPSTDEPTEEQDAGAVVVPVDAGSTADAADAAGAVGLQVFVTSTTTLGNMGGLVGADAICQTRGAALGARWAAWLSVEDGPNAVDRVTSAGPWLLPTGELVAVDKASLLAGRLTHAIDRDETGALHTDEHVWTGSDTNGRYSGHDCDAWTTGTNGDYGNSSASNGDWTEDDDERCTNTRRLYCFEL